METWPLPTAVMRVFFFFLVESRLWKSTQHLIHTKYFLSLSYILNPWNAHLFLLFLCAFCLYLSFRGLPITWVIMPPVLLCHLSGCSSQVVSRRGHPTMRTHCLPCWSQTDRQRADNENERSGCCHGSKYRSGRAEQGDSSSRFGDKEIFLRKVQAGVGSWSKSNKGNVERNTFQADHSGKGNFPSERLVGMQGPYCELLDLAGLQNMVRRRWSRQTGVKHPWAFLWHLGMCNLPEHIGCKASFYGILWFLPSPAAQTQKPALS